MWSGRQSDKQRQGQHYEQRALAYLARHGLVLIEPNFRCKCGEIDLVMLDQDTLVFVEVRQRANAAYGGAAASITRTKQRRIIGAAETFLLRYRAPPPCRFDIVSIDGSALAWLPGAFDV